MKKLLIRVQTIYGDVDYHEVSDEYCFCEDFSCLRVDCRLLQRKFYPEYRYIDLVIDFIFVDPEVI